MRFVLAVLLVLVLSPPGFAAQGAPSFIEELCSQEETEEAFKACMEQHPSCNDEKTEEDTKRCIDAEGASSSPQPDK